MLTLSRAQTRLDELHENANSSLLFGDLLYILIHPQLTREVPCGSVAFLENHSTISPRFLLTLHGTLVRLDSPPSHLAWQSQTNMYNCGPPAPEYVYHSDAMNLYIDFLMKKLKQFLDMPPTGPFNEWCQFCACLPPRDAGFYLGMQEDNYCLLCRVCNLPFWSSTHWGMLTQDVEQIQKQLELNRVQKQRPPQQQPRPRPSCCILQ